MQALFHRVYRPSHSQQVAVFKFVSVHNISWNHSLLNSLSISKSYKHILTIRTFITPSYYSSFIASLKYGLKISQIDGNIFIFKTGGIL